MNTASFPLVSIIIPTYNSADVIGETIESVLKQDYNNIEVIVIDDGSTDKTELVINKYLPKICYIKKQNGGVSSARNAGLMKATGKYIAFIDSDDVWPESNKISEQVEILSSNDQIVVVGSNGSRINIQGIPEIYKHNTHRKELSWHDLITFHRFTFSTIMIKRDIQFRNNVFFQEYLHRGQDVFFIMEIGYHGRLLFTNKLWSINKYSDEERKYSKYLIHDELETAFKYFTDKYPDTIRYRNLMRGSIYLRKAFWYKLRKKIILSKISIIRSFFCHYRFITLSNLFSVFVPNIIHDKMKSLIKRILIYKNDKRS